MDRKHLNNHISNLRWCTKKQNNQNMSKHKNATSVYKGVSFDKRSNKLHAKIHHNSKQIHLGYYTNEFDAGRAYDRKADELFKDFAKLNF